MRPHTHSLVALGLATAVAQAVLLREAMTVVAGSELAWGAVLAVWLTGMAAGARLGSHRGGIRLGRAAPVLAPTAALAGVVLLRAAPALAGAAPGETLFVLPTAWLWVAAVLPAALIGGLGFPILAGLSADGGDAGTAYALEAAGALAGGLLFSFALAPWGSAAALLVALAAALTTSLWHRSPLVASACAVALLAAAVPSSAVLERAGWHWARHGTPLAAWRETRQQRLELAGHGPVSLFTDGRLAATYPDPYLIAPRTHLLMLPHPAPRRVLAVGAVAGGSLPTILRHPVQRVDVVEDDPQLLAVLPRWYGPEMARALADPRVHTHSSDPLRVVSHGGPWDLVMLLDGDPTTLRRSRTRTRELLAAVRRHMAPGGVLELATGVGDTYLGGAGGRLLAVEAATLRAVFPRLAVLPGEAVTLVAAVPPDQLATDPATLAERWRRRGLADPVMSPALLRVLADPGRAATAAAALAASPAPVSTIRRPVVVLAAAAASEGRGQPGLATLLGELVVLPAWLLLAAAAVGAVYLLLRARTGASLGVEAAAALGFTSMTWWLLLLASWQATVGSVYTEVGALSAAFMAGLAGGAAIGRRRRDPRRALPWLLAAGVALSVAIAAGAPLAAPRLAVPLLLVAGGLFTGAAFPGAAQLVASSARRGGGVAFAADEAGAAAAALGVGLLALPWAGLGDTALAAAVLGAAMAAALVMRVKSQE